MDRETNVGIAVAIMLLLAIGVVAAAVANAQPKPLALPPWTTEVRFELPAVCKDNVLSLPDPKRERCV